MVPSEWFIRCKIRNISLKLEYGIPLFSTIELDCNYLKTNFILCQFWRNHYQISRDFVAAKRLRHRRPEDVYFSRKEFHILDKVCGSERGARGVVRLLDYYESPLQSVIITEYLEGNCTPSNVTNANKKLRKSPILDISPSMLNLAIQLSTARVF